MLSKYSKCRICCFYDSFDGCQNAWCKDWSDFKPHMERILDMAKGLGISVSDLLAMIELECNYELRMEGEE